MNYQNYRACIWETGGLLVELDTGAQIKCTIFDSNFNTTTLLTPNGDRVCVSYSTMNVMDVIPATPNSLPSTGDLPEPTQCPSQTESNPPAPTIVSSAEEQLIKLASELNTNITKLAEIKTNLLEGKSGTSSFVEFQQLSSSAATTADSITSSLQTLQESLQIDQEFIGTVGQFTHLSREELLQRLFEKCKKFDAKTAELAERERDFCDLVYRFKFLAKILSKTLKNPEEIDITNDYSSVFRAIFAIDDFSWERVDYRFWKMIDCEPGIEASRTYPCKPEWAIKPNYQTE